MCYPLLGQTTTFRISPAALLWLCLSEVNRRLRELCELCKLWGELWFMELKHQKHTHYRIWVVGRISPSFLTWSGVRQSYVLAPTRFYRVMDWILMESLSHSGLTISCTHFSDTNCSDDIATIDKSPAALAETLENMKNARSAFGLHVPKN